MPETPIAEVGFACGRHYLKVAGVIVAMEGDRCRDGNGTIPESVLPPIPADELEHATIGDKRAADMPIAVVRFFRGDNWTVPMLEFVATRINENARAARANGYKAGQERMKHQCRCVAAGTTVDLSGFENQNRNAFATCNMNRLREEIDDRLRALPIEEPTP